VERDTVVMYLGGFAPVGGIESFAHDFLLAIENAYPRRELAIWGHGSRRNPSLARIIDHGVKVHRTPWRWGCRWNLPDYILYRYARGTLSRASVVFFKRPPPRPILSALRKAHPKIPFVMVMPYRPLEYWGPSPHPDDVSVFDVIVVQSDQGRGDLKAFGYAGRIENIPYITPPTFIPVSFPCKLDAGVIKLGFLGRLEAQKNLGYLLECYRSLLSMINPETRCQLHLFGDGSQRENLQATCAHLDLKEVFFHGNVSRPEVAAAIDSCDLFLNTSLTEGQCLVALEVLSRGRPFVTTPVGALPEVIESEELGALAPLGDSTAFAKHLMRMIALISDGRLTPESVQAEYRRRYNRDKIISKYTDLIAELASARK
jgi:glycosyltransferase involved in cell wall biosynthesis